MSKILAPIGAPHTHGGNSVQRTMLLVMLALLPATLFNLYLFGWPALNMFVLTVGFSLASEWLALWAAGRPARPALLDGSAVLTAWLVAAATPPWAPWWIAVLGAFVSIVVGKQVFGGLGQNVFNPAMVARVALLISFPVQMTAFTRPAPLFAEGSPGFLDGLAITFLGRYDALPEGIDAFSAATPLGHLKTAFTQDMTVSQALPGHYEPVASLLGHMPGSFGETSAVLILAGGLFLIWKRIISWHIPVSMLGSVFLLALISSLLDAEHYPGPIYHLSTGALMLGAFFIATDLVTSPVTKLGQIIFGVGIGVLVFIIRTFTAYPEGVGFAVLLMNAMTPLIDHYIRPRVYGRTRSGDPLEPPKDEAPDTAKAEKTA
ncbi:MAG: RnfABCDGE type electron transport complex subunit D [Gammaproteobacteria bacterium]